MSFLHIVQETKFVSDSGNNERYEHELIICVYRHLVTNDYLKQGLTVHALFHSNISFDCLIL